MLNSHFCRTTDPKQLNTKNHAELPDLFAKRDGIVMAYDNWQPDIDI
jgi:hypothetical protein